MVVQNSFKGYTNHTVEVVTDFTQSAVMSRILSEYNKGRRIVVPVTSKITAEKIHSELKRVGCRVGLYTGDNLFDVDGTLMMDVKKRDFKNVNASWIDFQVVIYTMCLTAGVSFDQSGFDMFVGVYEGTTSPDLFA